ncbi:MAG TPA: hypothetical protein VGG70_05405 [Candidatus Cybelea sp.]
MSNALGRIDGVDRRPDNPNGSRSDSRALQPQCDGIALGVALGVTMW